MKIQNEFTFEAHREKVWELLMDPEVMANAIPGTKRLERKGEDEYVGEIRVGIGPVSGAFSISIALKDKAPPQGYTMVIFAKGRPGFVNGTARVELSEDDSEATLMKYSAELQLGGKIAAVGQRLLDSVSKSMTKRSLKALSKSLQERLKDKSG